MSESSGAYFDTQTEQLSIVIFQFLHSHKKREDSLVGSLDQVFFAAEFKFMKIVAPRLPQNSSNANTE